jgi:hypothetical protein
VIPLPGKVEENHATTQQLNTAVTGNSLVASRI